MSGKIGAIIQQSFVLDFKDVDLDLFPDPATRQSVLGQLDRFFRPETCKRQLTAGLNWENSKTPELEMIRRRSQLLTGVGAYAFLLGFDLGIFSDRPGETHAAHQVTESWGAYHSRSCCPKAMVSLMDQMFSDARQLRNIYLKDMPRPYDAIAASLTFWGPAASDVLVVCGESSLTSSVVLRLLLSKKKIHRVTLSHPDENILSGCMDKLRQVLARKSMPMVQIGQALWNDVRPSLLLQAPAVYVCHPASPGGDKWGIDRDLAALPKREGGAVLHLRGSLGSASVLTGPLQSADGIIGPQKIAARARQHNAKIHQRARRAAIACDRLAEARAKDAPITTRLMAEDSFTQPRDTGNASFAICEKRFARCREI